MQARVMQNDTSVEVRWLTQNREWEVRGTHPARYLSILPENIWAFLLLDDADLLIAIADRCRPTEEHPDLEPVASTTAAEADEFGTHLAELHLSPTPGWKVLNTGIIEPYAPVWGLERMYSGGTAYLRPVLPRQTASVPQRRKDQYGSAKLIFSKLCKQLTAAIDSDGVFAGLNVNFIVGDIDSIDLYGAIYNSSVMRWVYEGYFGALRMSGGYMQVQAPQLRVLPLPAIVFDQAAHSQDPLLTEIKALGRDRRLVEVDRVVQRLALVDALQGALGVQRKRDTEPAWVMPRQRQLRERIEDRQIQDLAPFWETLRLTARDLRVEITPRREHDVLTAVQAARPRLQDLGRRAEGLDADIDALVFRLYGLGDDDIARIRTPRPVDPVPDHEANTTSEEEIGAT
jgi:hypothetical protein